MPKTFLEMLRSFFPIYAYCKLLEITITTTRGIKNVQQLPLENINQTCLYSIFVIQVNPLSANPTKWSNTLKQFVGNLPTNCLNVFDHFVGMALKGLTNSFASHSKVITDK